MGDSAWKGEGWPSKPPVIERFASEARPPRYRWWQGFACVENQQARGVFSEPRDPSAGLEQVGIAWVSQAGGGCGV